MLAIAVAIIAVPSRPIRRIGLEKAVDNGDALEDQRIVGLPEAEPHELEEIRPDHLAGGDPCIITVRTRASRQLSAADREPALDAGIPEICEIERPSSGICRQERGTLDKRRDGDSQGEGVDPGILL